ncbi:saccharopine dehydrogenase NADP-binding domain-containing protein [Lacimicrobium sp. SS2-24]|uniref:saccharopine dehydrogenase family protein n=1 Tax=Lacimicrobium sp. SS2-24 TaxID=2005569 RepID=UPI001AEFC786|nr:saccharopine dehydrogenase NADP-binding domain-containing protein [Lacimicrobium sp. SS2-24]
MKSKWMIYGANGYSAQLIAREAKQRGMTPVLAGRNKDKVTALANELGLQAVIVDLSDGQALRESLKEMALVLHCAGPFSATHEPMREACIDTATHYFDITGEIAVFEQAHAQDVDKRAKAAGMMVCPGVGFDVVPTDCLAAKLKQALPSATHLELAYKAAKQLSPGTAKTSVESMGSLCQVRENGQITGIYSKTRQIDFGEGERLAMTIPWGDVSTAYHSTGIKNVAVYVPVHPKTVEKMHKIQKWRWFYGLSFVQNMTKKQIEKKISGPDEAVRKSSPTYLWGQVWDDDGNKRTARFTCPNGYDLTITAPLAIISAVLNEEVKASGSITPSKLMGEDFVWTLPDVTPLEWVED